MKPGAIVVLCMSLFFILFFPLAPIQWVSIFALIVLLSSFLYSRAQAKSVVVYRRHPSVKTFKFQVARIEIVVQNRGILPIPYVAIVDNSAGFHAGSDDRAVFSLRGRERRTISYEVKGYNRGAFELGPVKIMGSDPIGFFPWQRLYGAQGRLVVYPTVYPISIPSFDGIPSGSIKVSNPIYEDVTNYRSLREYMPGDDPRKINWKVSARTGTLHTMEYLPAVYFPSIVLLNLTAPDYQQRNRYQHSERTIEAAASLVSHLAGLGLSVGLFSTGVFHGTQDIVSMPVESGYGHAMAILEVLSRIQINEVRVDIIRSFFGGVASTDPSATPTAPLNSQTGTATVGAAGSAAGGTATGAGGGSVGGAADATAPAIAGSKRAGGTIRLGNAAPQKDGRGVGPRATDSGESANRPVDEIPGLSASAVRIPAGSRIFYVGPRLTQQQRLELGARKGVLKVELCYTDEGVQRTDSFLDPRFRVYRITVAGVNILE